MINCTTIIDGCEYEAQIPNRPNLNDQGGWDKLPVTFREAAPDLSSAATIDLELNFERWTLNAITCQPLGAQDVEVTLGGASFEVITPGT